MFPIEWYRNFVAVYRAGSVSGAARSRHLTQPAVSQQLASLEALVGSPLFERTPRGMLPTERGKQLYAQVFDALDKLERVSRGLKGRPAPDTPPTLRLGASPEYVQGFALERLRSAEVQLRVTFGEGKDLLSSLESGVLDAVISTSRPTSRTLQHRTLAENRFVLVGPPTLEGPGLHLSAPELGKWLNGGRWVSYSAELPITRRFWQQHLGARFEAELVMVVPDLRGVLRAVELGYGMSILPEYLCREALDQGRVREVWPVRGLIPSEQWIMAFREVDAERTELTRVAELLSVPDKA